MGLMDGCQGHENENELIEVDCPKCGEVIEYYSHDKEAKCPKCGEAVPKEE